MTELIQDNPDLSDDAPKGSRRALYWKIAKWVLIVGTVLAVIMAVALSVWLVRATKDLPSVKTLSEYKPAVMSRVHAGDGKLISEFRTEARVFVPIESVPVKLQQAFVSSEDKRFYTHNGWDPIGLTRAVMSVPSKKLKGQRVGGTSTITQQVAKNFLVGDDYSMKRKIREIAIARRMEKAFSKGEILELYLNDNYFGRGAYGVAAAALNHFGKEMDDLSVGEMAYLALVVKGPANYELDDPEEYASAKSRQRYVLDRMAEDGYISQEDADDAYDAPLEWTDRLTGAEYLAAEYFVEEARKQIFAMYGSDELYSGGLSIRTTLDTDMQLAGRRALRRGIEMLDRRMGWRGPLKNIENIRDWATELDAFTAPVGVGDWRIAVVLEREATSATLGFVVEPDEGSADADADGEAPVTETGTMDLSDIQWAGKSLTNGRRGNAPSSMAEVISVGDVILVEPHLEKDAGYNLRQVPDVNGALIAMDPHTGRVKALIGGYSFEQSQFNRVTQAYRQPGSSFKPFVYAAALGEGFTPASQVLDAPFVVERFDARCFENEYGVLELRASSDDRSSPARSDECERFYKPENYDAGTYYGMSTLRLGIEKSRNAMTVRLANDIGMQPIMEIGRKFGIYDNPRPELAWALGAGESSLLRMATAYSMMINGGKRVVPSILDRVQDGRGETIFVNSDVVCADCQQDEYTGQAPPILPDMRDQIIDPMTAYQMSYMMIGVVENGTGAKLRALGRPIGGKTGTTNDSKDNWFMAFTPDLVVGVYVGKDTPEPMARETGSTSAVPIVLDFLTEVLDGEPTVPFRIPDGLTLAPVNRNTGEPSFIGAPDVILEAFKPGTEPQVGSLVRTIRIGSGGDTFGSGFFGSGDVLDGSVPADLGEGPSYPQPGPDDPAFVPIGPNTPDSDNLTPKPNEPKEEPEPEPVRDLDDGLY